MRNIVSVFNGQADAIDFMHDKTGSLRWRRECLEMQEAGVYEEIAGHIEGKRYELMLNICCGFCPLEQHLARSNPSAHFIGIDINTETLQGAREDLSRAGVGSHVYRARAGDNIIADPDILTQGNLYQKPWETMRGQVLLVEGDVARIAKTLSDATNGKKADMSVHTFMGISHKLYDREQPDQLELQVSSIHNPVELATRMTQRNGTLISAQRAVQPRGQSIRKTLEKVEELYAALFGPFWKFAKKPTVLHTDISEIPTAGTPAFSDRVLKRAYIVEGKRTKAEADPEAFTAIRANVRAYVQNEDRIDY